MIRFLRVRRELFACGELIARYRSRSVCRIAPFSFLTFCRRLQANFLLRRVDLDLGEEETFIRGTNCCKLGCLLSGQPELRKLWRRHCRRVAWRQEVSEETGERERCEKQVMFIVGYEKTV